MDSIAQEAGEQEGTKNGADPPAVQRSEASEAAINLLSLWAGYLLILGGLAMVIGGLLSWNFFRVAGWLFYGKVVLKPGTRLTVLVLGVVALFQARSVLRGKISPTRQRRYWKSVAIGGGVALFVLSHYADTIQGLLERWVVDTYSSTIAAGTTTPVKAVQASLRQAIARHDVYLTLRPGFFIAVAGSVLLLGAATLLFVDARRSAATRTPARAPGEGLRGILPEDVTG